MSGTVLAVVAIVLAMAVLVVPGAAALAVLGVRDGRLLTAAPAATCVPLMAATAVLHVLHVPWRPLAAAAAIAVILGALALATRLLRRGALHRGSESRSTSGSRVWAGSPILERTAQEDGGEAARTPRLALAALLMLASGLIVAPPVLHGMGGITTLNGSFDAFFHHSALRAVRESGDAFPMTALAPVYGGSSAFYPTAWHALASLLPGDVITASNAMAIAMLALLPVTVYGVTARCVLPADRTLGPPLAAVVALATTLFMSPAMLSLVGGLWPFALGVLTLPVGVAALLGSSSWSVRVLVILGTAAAHPSTAFSLLVVVGAVCVAQTVRWGLVRRRGSRALAWALPAAAIVLVLTVLVPLRLGDMQLTDHDPSTFWSTLVVALLDRPRVQAIPLNPQVMALLLALALIGLVLSLVRRRWLGLTAALIGGAGLALTYSAQAGDLSWFGRLSSPWYGARERIQPLLLLATVMAATIGATALPSLAGRAAAAAGARAASWTRSAVAVLVAGGLMASILVSADAPRRLQRVSALAYTAYGLQLLPYAAPAEVAFIRASGEDLPPGAVVLGSPLDGTSLYYALEGVEVVYPSLAATQTLEQRRIGRYADELAEPGSLACDALRDEGVTHVYRDLSIHSGAQLRPERTQEDFAGIARIPASQLTEVARSGDYVLYALDVPC